MPNRLSGETSPYLLQHADNPVDWMPWGEEAFAEARRSNRPVLLSVGYAACHWCHVMAHESFEDPVTAEVMNRLFVNIKVDREERPEVDHVYMAALHALGQQGGWPLTMFLDPDGAPFWGGTYFPPDRRYGRPAFRDVLEAVARAFEGDRDAVARNTAALGAHLAALASGGTRGALDEPLLGAACGRLAGIVDPVAGGLKGAPKFPQAALLGLLLRQGRRTGDDRLAALALLSLERMAAGGIYDHLGGGFARYAVDERWLVPHFEKMLYDNALLLPLLARAHVVTGDETFRRRAVATADWMTREMTAPDGAFVSSLDADTDGEEGATYLWTPEQVTAVLGARAADFMTAYDIAPGGNFEGRSIPNRLAPARGGPDETAFDDDRARLLAARSTRPQPARDDKVLADWNGLAVAGLATAGRLLARPDMVAAAARAFRAVVDTMSDAEGRLAHSRLGDRVLRPGLAADQAAMALAAVSVGEATGDRATLGDAARFLAALDRHHGDGGGLYHLTADDAPPLLVRPLAVLDDAVPGHHGIAAEASIRLHLATGDPEALARADRILGAVGPAVAGNVLGGASLLAALALRLDLPTATVLGPPGPARDALLAAAARARPDAVPFAAESDEGLPGGHPARGKGAPAAPLAFLCEGGRCGLPVSDPADLVAAGW